MDDSSIPIPLAWASLPPSSVLPLYFSYPQTFLDNLIFAINSPEASNIPWLPSLDYGIFSRLFEYNALATSFLFLGFSFGIQSYVEHYKSIPAAEDAIISGQ